MRRDYQPPHLTIRDGSSGIRLPQLTNPVSVFSADDEDGAAGDVTFESIALNGCRFFDGLSFGDRDGLLRDESATVEELLFMYARTCGPATLVDPTMMVHVQDCAGNVTTASRAVLGYYIADDSACTP